jgi:predicted phage replisome organizer
MAKVQWIKITTDIFDNDKIKLIEKLPEGDTMLIIWLKILILAGKKNESGMIYITRDIPFTADTLADVMGRDSKIVSLALNTFKSFNMIDIIDDFIKVVNWEKYQNIEGLEKMKEQNRLRQQKFRETQKQIESNVTITLRNDIDKNRIDKNRKEKEIYISYSDNVKLTEKEYNSLIAKYGNTNTQKFIEKLENYKGATGKKYKSDYKAILSWVVDAIDKGKKVVKEIDEYDRLKDQSDKYLEEIARARKEKENEINNQHSI